MTQNQYEARVQRLHDALEPVEIIDSDDDTPIQQVWSMTRQTAIENRTDQLISEATDEVVLVIGDESLLTPDLVDTLNEVGNGVTLVIGALTESLQDRIQAEVPAATTFISGLEWLHGGDIRKDETAIGRLLLIDRSTILMS